MTSLKVPSVRLSEDPENTWISWKQKRLLCSTTFFALNSLQGFISSVFFSPLYLARPRSVKPASPTTTTTATSCYSNVTMATRRPRSSGSKRKPSHEKNTGLTSLSVTPPTLYKLRLLCYRTDRTVWRCWRLCGGGRSLPHLHLNARRNAKQTMPTHTILCSLCCFYFFTFKQCLTQVLKNSVETRNCKY